MEFSPSIFPVTKEIVAYNRKKEMESKSSFNKEMKGWLKQHEKEERKAEASLSDSFDGLPSRRVDLSDGGFYYVFKGLRRVVEGLLKAARKKMNKEDEQ